MAGRGPWRGVQALLFDYGMTLVTFFRPTEALFSAHAAASKLLEGAGVLPVVGAETLLREVHDRVENAVARNEMSGNPREIDLVAEQSRAYAALGLRLPAKLLDEIDEVIQRAWWEGVAVAPATVTTLEALRHHGLRLGLCSNAPYRPRSLHAQLRHLGLERLFDSVSFSSEVGWRKPAPQIFDAALAALGTAAAGTAMVGDRRWEDVAGARARGMATIRLREHQDDPGPDDADAVIDHISELVELLFPPQEGGKRGSVVGDDTSS